MQLAVTVWSIIVAGGTGARFGGLKQFERLGAQTMLAMAATTARKAGDGVVVVVPERFVPEVAAEYLDAVVVAGGASRSESVRCGLAVVPAVATLCSFMMERVPWRPSSCSPP